MVAGLDRVFRCARTIVWSAVRHDAPPVLVRHAPTGRFLATDGTWTDDTDRAVVIADPHHAARILDRLSCEPVFDLVQLSDVASAA
jgi:hypothetical protein